MSAVLAVAAGVVLGMAMSRAVEWVDARLLPPMRDRVRAGWTDKRGSAVRP